MVLLTNYVFSILKSTDTKQACEECQAEINNHNSLLRRLSSMLFSDCNLILLFITEDWFVKNTNSLRSVV